MAHLNNPSNSSTSGRPQSESGDMLDAFLIDDEFDDFLDREIAAIRESLADFSTLQYRRRP